LSQGPPQPAWHKAWFSQAKPRHSTLWRGVEAQHIVATLRLVDNLAEQEALERILENSKPALPLQVPQGQHYLLSTPFRYRSPYGSRFRRAHTAGVWYGCETLLGATAEVAYWRWRFVSESTGLHSEPVYTQHSFFQARASGLAIDLTAQPWVANQALWVHDTDYQHSQAVADAARSAGVQWLRYTSVREPSACNGAVFDPQVLTMAEPVAPQTWHCKASISSVSFQRERERYAWHFAASTQNNPLP
jgi:hypothetical protein